MAHLVEELGRDGIPELQSLYNKYPALQAIEITNLFYASIAQKTTKQCGEMKKQIQKDLEK